MAKDTNYWYQRTIEQLLLTGKSKRTAETYAREVRILGKYVDCPLEEVDEEELRQFILYRLNDCKLAGSSMRILYCGLKALYQNVMGNKWPLLEVLKAQKEVPLPMAIDRTEVGLILAHALTPQIMTYLRTVYSCGLRLEEALNLEIGDINGTRMLLHVRGKGARDRYVPLPGKTYRFLKRYWSLHRNPRLIFPALGRSGNDGPTATQPMSRSSVQGGLRRAVKRAGLAARKITLHTLRHSYATHLLEANVTIRTVQEYLGHATLQHTVRYLHITKHGREQACLTINIIMGDI